MTLISVVLRDFMKFTSLPIVLICVSIPLLFLWQGLVVLSFSYVLRAKVSLSLLLRWICRSRVLLVLLSKFPLNFDSMPIERSK